MVLRDSPRLPPFVHLDQINDVRHLIMRAQPDFRRMPGGRAGVGAHVREIDELTPVR